MIAALPMYDWPELREAHDSFWLVLQKNLNAQGINAPLNLTRNIDDQQPLAFAEIATRTNLRLSIFHNIGWQSALSRYASI